MAILERVPNKAVLARDLGVTYSWLHRILSGKALPSVSLAKRIQAATGGGIQWGEFFQDTPPLRDDGVGVPIIHRDHPISKRDRHTMMDCGTDDAGPGADLSLEETTGSILTAQNERLAVPAHALPVRRGNLILEKSEPKKQSHRASRKKVA